MMFNVQLFTQPFNLLRLKLSSIVYGNLLEDAKLTNYVFLAEIPNIFPFY